MEERGESEESEGKILKKNEERTENKKMKNKETFLG